MNRFLVASAAAVVVCLLLVGCDVPTDPPILEQRWVVPIEETALSVDEFLPSGVTIVGSNFSVSIDPFLATSSLATMCPACTALNGLTVPLPAFSTSLSASKTLPADVFAATIASAEVAVAVQNGLSFDPIAGGGSLTITISDGQGGTTLGEVVVTGATMSPGGTLTRTVSIGASSIGATLFASVEVVSVGGQVALIETSEQVTVTATTTSLLASSATVDVGTQFVEFDPEELDVEDIGSDVVKQIQEGSIVLDITNPFGVSIEGSIVIGTEQNPVTKSLSIGSGSTSSVTITYTNAELRQWLGQPGVTFSGSGTATGGSVTVSPSDELTIDITLDATIRIG